MGYVAPIPPGWPRHLLTYQEIWKLVFLWKPQRINNKTYWFTFVYKQFKKEYNHYNDLVGVTATGKYLIDKKEVFLDQL